MKTDNIVSAKDFSNHPGWFNALNYIWGKSYSLGLRSSLNKDDLLKNAQRITGLSDFGKDFMDEPLDRLIWSLENEARLHPVGHFISRNRIINLLTVRLRAEFWFKKHPEILEQEIYPPIVIVGLQRTGTTKLHRLLNADPENRVLKSWEAINPAPFNHLKGSKDKRVRIARTSENALRRMAPGFFAIHPVEHYAPEEDILLLDTTFLSTTPEATTHVPTYAAWLENTDQSNAYAYLSKLLKLLQWQDPAKRWILKSPHHMEFLPLIQKYLGDAQFIWTHRNPIECIPSFLSMVCHSRSIFSNEVKSEEVVEHWVRKTTYMLEKGLEFRNTVNNDAAFTDILYEHLVTDSMGQLLKIYEKQGGISPELMKKFRETEANNPQGKYGVHDYSYTDFGLSREELAARNSKYCKQYSDLLKAESIQVEHAC
ncbi:sulfotransferase [Bacteroidota bacterium]